MEAKFFVYAGLRWRKLDVESGRVSGWAHRARFLVSRAGKLHLVRRSRVLRGLRALAAGQPSCVREAAPLTQRRHYSPKRKQRRDRHHCCCNTNKRALQHVQKVTLCNATTQTVVVLDAAVEALPGNRSPQVDQLKSGPLKHKTLLTAENPPQKKEKKTVVDKTSLKHQEEAPQTDTDAQSCKELIINEDDVDALRNFLDKNNLFDVDLESFDADDNYKSMVFYKINPLVSIERCPRIGRMYRRRNSNDISLADFATKLGLRAVTDLAVKKRYKMRNRGPHVGMSTESDKENHSDSSVTVVSDSSIEKSTTSRGPLKGQVSKKNISQKRQFGQPNIKNTLFKRALQRNSQSSNKSKVERVSTSEWSKSNDSGSESSESKRSDSDSAFESPSERRVRLSRPRNVSESKLQSSLQKTRLQSSNDKGSKKIKKANSLPIRRNEGNSPFERDGIKPQPVHNDNESKLQSDQNANKSKLRPLRRRSEVDLLLELGKSQSTSKKRNELGIRTKRKTNESASELVSKDNESETKKKVSDAQSRHRADESSSRSNHKKKEGDLQIESETRREKNNELNARVSRKPNKSSSRPDSKNDQSKKDDDAASRTSRNNKLLSSRTNKTIIKNRRKNEVELLQENKSKIRKLNKLDARPNRGKNEFDTPLNARKNKSSEKEKKLETVLKRKTNESASQSSRINNESDVLHKDKKVDDKHKENKSDTRHKNISDNRHNKNKAETQFSKNSKSDSKFKNGKYGIRQIENNKSDTLQRRNFDDSDSQSSLKENESDSRLTQKVMHSESSPKKKFGMEGQPASLIPSSEDMKRALRPPRANDSTISSYREYSSLEDHAIVAWVSRGARARLVNGNRVWRELQTEYAGLVGVERSWHSLRNRYLRYILPRLGDLAISPPRASELRAAAARGEIKSSRRPPPPASPPPRVRSAWGARPRPRVRSASSSDKEISSDHLTNGGVRASPPRQKTEEEEEGAPPTSSRASRSQRRAPPTYSELTRRFAPRLRSTPNASPAPRRRRLYNP